MSTPPASGCLFDRMWPGWTVLTTSWGTPSWVRGASAPHKAALHKAKYSFWFNVVPDISGCRMKYSAPLKLWISAPAFDVSSFWTKFNKHNNNKDEGNTPPPPPLCFLLSKARCWLLLYCPTIPTQHQKPELGRYTLAWHHPRRGFFVVLANEPAPGLPRHGYLPPLCFFKRLCHHRPRSPVPLSKHVWVFSLPISARSWFSLTGAWRWCHGSFIQLCPSRTGWFNCTIINKIIFSVPALLA